MAHGWPPAAAGGTELYAAALASAQARAGLHVAHWTPTPRRRLRFVETFADAAVDEAFGRVLAAGRPDLVHVHHLTGASMGIGAVTRAAGARLVITLHDAWLACARGQLVDRGGQICPGPEEARCARCLAPALWAPLPPALADRLPPRRDATRARATALAALASHADEFLTPSRHLAARLGLPASYLPLPLIGAVPPAPPPGEGPVRFLFLGGLIPTKGPHLAVEAFARLPAGAATLRLVGAALPYDGRTTYADALRRRVAEVPGARLDPAVPHDAIGRVLAEADVLLFPSTWEENSPLVLREAAAAGLRVVASDVPGAAEVLGDAGARVEPGSVDAWRRALAAEVRRGRGREPPVVSEDMDAHARRVVGVYRDVLARSARPAVPAAK